MSRFIQILSSQSPIGSLENSLLKSCRGLALLGTTACVFVCVWGGEEVLFTFSPQCCFPEGKGSVVSILCPILECMGSRVCMCSSRMGQIPPRGSLSWAWLVKIHTVSLSVWDFLHVENNVGISQHFKNHFFFPIALAELWDSWFCCKRSSIACKYISVYEEVFINIALLFWPTEPKFLNM